MLNKEGQEQVNFERMPSEDLKRSADFVAKDWVESSYYSDAERWTFIFWDEGTVFHRMFKRLDLVSTVELACGRGRHSERIADEALGLVLMDIHGSNLAACRRRLGGRSSISFVVNSGFDFQPLQTNSVTAIFCYDSMVHFAPDVIASYLRDAARVLCAGGRALFHHSNYDAPNSNWAENPHARNDMTQQRFQQLAETAGLIVLESEVIGWGGIVNLDCLTLVERP